LHLEREVPGAPWTFGGGTVLMLRLAHRQSKDIDLFVPDPQYLGYVNPRLSFHNTKLLAEEPRRWSGLSAIRRALSECSRRRPPATLAAGINNAGVHRRPRRE